MPQRLTTKSLTQQEFKKRKSEWFKIFVMRGQEKSGTISLGHL